VVVALHFLGKETQSGNSPTLWADGSDYIIQGFTVDEAILAEIGGLPAGEEVIRVPKKLMEHLSRDLDDTRLV
jgi:hypothetical protein